MKTLALESNLYRRVEESILKFLKEKKTKFNIS